MPFTADAVIGEERITAEEFTGEVDYALPEPPTPQEIIAASGGIGVEAKPDLLDLDGLAAQLLGRQGLDAFRIGRLLKRHDFTQGILALLDGEPLDEWGLRDRLARFGYAWGRTARENPQLVLQALARFVALLSAARDPDSDERRPRPLLHVEAHLWVRPVTRVLRGVGRTPEFRWYEDDRTQARRAALAAAPPRTRRTVPPRAMGPRAGRTGRSPWRVRIRRCAPRRCICPPCTAALVGAPAGPRCPRSPIRSSSSWRRTGSGEWRRPRQAPHPLLHLRDRPGAAPGTRRAGRATGCGQRCRSALRGGTRRGAGHLSAADSGR